MSQFFFLLPLLSVGPLVGGLVSQMGAMAVSGLVWAIFLGVLLVTPDGPQRSFVLSQFPLFALITGTSLYWTHRWKKENNLETQTTQESELRTLRDRHQGLKEDVARLERVENESLQIYGVAKSLAEALSWKDMAPRLTNGIQKIFGAYEFLLYAFDEEGDWNLLLRRGGWAKEPPLAHTMPTEASVLSPSQSSEVVPILSVPIYSVLAEGRRMKGALFLKMPQATRTEEELRLLGAEFGEQVGLTLNKAFLFSQMETQSRTDGLTGVLRRQPFMDRLADELKRARAFQTPFSLLMVDIDHFKSINDTHGHAAGDAVLTTVGHLLKSSVYETDVVGRYGGEEFILLLPKAQADGVRRKADAIRQRLEREIIRFGFEQLHITVSIGIAHYPAHGTSGDQLIAQADKALYRAKDTGRNRVVES